MMHTKDVVKLLLQYRDDGIVIPGRGGRYWVELTDNPHLDAPVGDPAMGGHAAFALGLALARPERRVILFDSEGDLLMNLGILATIAEQAPSNLYHFMLDNECYATTGGQPVPNAKHVAYDMIARGAGYPYAAAFADLEEVERALPGVLSRPGPVFIALKVEPEIENAPIARRARWNPRTRQQVIADLKQGLTGAPIKF